MAFFGRFFGRAGSEAAGIALGATAVPALLPAAQYVVNEAWQLHPDRPPDVYAVAAGVAQGQIPQAEAQTWANQQGISNAAFAALVNAANVGPAFGNLMDAYRRGLLDDTAFNTGLERLAIEPQWWPALRSLRRTLLSAQEAANARQQNWITQSEQHAIAGEHGLTPADAEVQFLTVGLPPGIETGLEMLRRNIIGTAEFAEIVATSHTKTKWTSQLLAMQARVLNAATYAGLFLRGWITRAQMDAGGALTGYDPAQMDLLYKEHGRPATGRQVFIGMRRGGIYNGPTAGIPQTFVDAIRQSNIRPEWTNLLWAARYTYPSAFVLRGLTQAGDLTQVETEQILLYEGWEPTLAATVSTKWAGGTGTTSDPHVSKAQTQLWTTLHRSYVVGDTDAPTAQARLGTLGVAAAAQPQVLALWDAEKALTRKELTPTQLKKAYSSGAINPATGSPYTQAEVIGELVLRGYSPADATTFLSL